MQNNDLLLVIDTTLQGGYFGLAESLNNDFRLIYQLSCMKPQDTGRCLVSFVEMLENFIEPSSLSSIVLSVGPGSFTGIKIGVGFVQGLVLGSKFSSCRILTTSSIDAMSRTNPGSWVLKSTRTKGYLSIDGETSVIDLKDVELASRLKETSAVNVLGQWSEFSELVGNENILTLSSSEIGLKTLSSMILDIEHCQEALDGTVIPNYVRQSAPEEKLLQRD